MTEAERLNRLRVHVAEYDAHRERPEDEQAETASWWYAAWADALVPVLRDVLAAVGKGGEGMIETPTDGETFPPAPLPGHELLDDGKPFVIGAGWALPGDQPGCTPGLGHAICSCGTVSPELRADAARRTWHHAHVSEIRASMTRKPVHVPWDGKPFQVGRWTYGTEGKRP